MATTFCVVKTHLSKYQVQNFTRSLSYFYINRYVTKSTEFALSEISPYEVCHGLRKDVFVVYYSTPTDRMSGRGVVMMSIDNLPAQLPREATDHFGSRLFPYIYDSVRLPSCVH